MGGDIPSLMTHAVVYITSYIANSTIRGPLVCHSVCVAPAILHKSTKSMRHTDIDDLKQVSLQKLSFLPVVFLCNGCPLLNGMHCV